MTNTEQRWIPVHEAMPEAQRLVLATMVDRYHTEVIRAMWVPEHSAVDDGTFQGDTDYDEATDEYYWPEGWYENNANDETLWRVHDDVVAWMPLPAPYTAATEGGKP